MTDQRDRADRVAERLAIPVLIAALASVPAVFLTLLDDPWETVGNGLNLLSGAVLVAETVVLFALAEDRRGWVRRNRLLVLLAAVIVPAVVFAVGPVQLLRLVRVVGALRIIRVGRIMKAGRIVRERAGLHRRWQRLVGVLVSLLAAGFVAVVLVDDTSASRQLLDGFVSTVGVVGVIVAGVILAVATFIVRINRDENLEDGPSADEPADHQSGTREPGQSPSVPSGAGSSGASG